MSVTYTRSEERSEEHSQQDARAFLHPLQRQGGGQASRRTPKTKNSVAVDSWCIRQTCSGGDSRIHAVCISADEVKTKSTEMAGISTTTAVVADTETRLTPDPTSHRVISTEYFSAETCAQARHEAGGCHPGQTGRLGLRSQQLC